MAKDVLYTNGVIAAKETGLLSDKIFKLCEMSAEDAFRSLSESGFLRNSEAQSVHEYEKALTADTADIDEFIREYSPTDAEKIYFLAPRDFHNAKALVKSECTGADVQDMLAPDGLIPVAELAEAVKSGDVKNLPQELAEAVICAKQRISDVEKQANGAEIGNIFENSAFKYISKACKGNRLLKKFTVKRADMTNILTALRAQTPEYAQSNYVYGGKLSVEKLNGLFAEDYEKALADFKDTDYYGFVKDCLLAKAEGKPFTSAEKTLYLAETEELEKRKYELKNSQPFIYYVLRRRTENDNLRIIFACLLAGVEQGKIKARLRAVI